MGHIKEQSVCICTAAGIAKSFTRMVQPRMLRIQATRHDTTGLIPLQIKFPSLFTLFRVIPGLFDILGAQRQKLEYGLSFKFEYGVFLTKCCL